MQVVSTPYESIKPGTGIWVAEDNPSFPAPFIAITGNALSSDVTTSTVSVGLNTINVSQQPNTVIVEGVTYQQVAGNPQPGQYSYNQPSGIITINSVHTNKQVVIENSADVAAVISPAYSSNPLEFTQTPLFDRVPIDELGTDFYGFLINIGAGHSGELLLNYSHSQGGFPAASLEIEILTDEIEVVLTKINDNISSRYIHYIYKTPFHLKPVNVTYHDNTNVVTLVLEFESIYAPRGEYNPLDRYVYINKDTQIPFASLLANNGVQVREVKGFVSTKQSDKKERRQIRGMLESLAAAQASFLDFSQPKIVLTNSLTTRQHTLPNNFSILPDYSITTNGLIGAPLINGIRLSSPWVYKGWIPDEGGLIIEDENVVDSDTDNEFLETREIKRMGDPDLTPSTPTKILDGIGYSYISEEEITRFPEMAQNPSVVVYPNGFKKSVWEQINEHGFNAGQNNGEEWGWQINSKDVWSYYDEPVANPDYGQSGQPQFLYFQKDPVWQYTAPVYSAHWKKCRTWNLQVSFDVNGYPYIEQEIGSRWIQPKTESDNRTAAQLLYDADKLEYEASMLRAEALTLPFQSTEWQEKQDEAKDKDGQAAVKRKDASLYNFQEFPYTKTVRRFYRKLSIDRPEILDEQEAQPCDQTERETQEKQEPASVPAYFLEREITEEKSLFTIPSPYKNELPITIGETYEKRHWVIVSPLGYQIFESLKTSAQQSGNTTNVTSSEWRTGSPDVAPRKPDTPLRRKKKTPDKKPENKNTTYLNTAGGSSVSFRDAARSTVSLEGVRNFSLAYPALLEMYRQENLTSEQTSTDSPWYRIIKPGDRAFWMGKSWKCTDVSRTDKLGYGGLIQCQSFRCNWGSWIPDLTLSVSTVSECAI